MFNQQFYPGYMPNYTPQPIQQYQTLTPQSVCYFVKSIDEMGNIRVQPNVYYMGINRDNKEIYVRKMNNDGNIEVETYILKSEEKQKSQMDDIADRITNIENILKERKHEQSNGYASQQSNQQQTQYYASVPATQTNV